MKSKLKLLLTFLIIFFVFGSYNISEASSEAVEYFQSNIELNRDGTVSFKEYIEYNFGNNQQHGLVRNLIYKKTNQDGKKYVTEITGLEVSDNNGNPYNFYQSKKGDYIELKIGDENKLVSGIKTYVITYTVLGSFTYFTDHDEFYWNLTGNEWDVPIKSFVSHIKLPENVSEDQISVLCYSGIYGSTDQSCEINIMDSVIEVSSSKILEPGEGLTLVISLPKGVVGVLEPKIDKPSFFQILILVLVAIAALFWFIFLPIKVLSKYIKDRKFTKSHEKIVSAWFEPPQYDDGDVFTPAETGFIVDKSIDHKELTATIIHLAQRGYLKIKEEKKGRFTFVKLKDTNPDELKDFEIEILEAIFEKGNEVTDKELKKSTSIFTSISKFNKKVEEILINKQMFDEKPSSVFVKNMVFFSLGLATMNIPLSLFSLLGKNSAKRSLLGVEKYSEAKSLMNFLKSQDEQLNFQSKNQMFFEKLLPYATAFGVEKIWAERFKDISMQKPNWYEGDNFTNSIFIGSMTRSIGGSLRSASSAPSTRSSSGFSSGSSGGGFSGGGGGGGGGGSW